MLRIGVTSLNRFTPTEKVGVCNAAIPKPIKSGFLFRAVTIKEMAYGAKTYTLREESTESDKRYFISFKDGQGERHELEVFEQLFIEFRQMERKNRNLQQWNQRHREFNEVWDETLYRRALRVPKMLDERMIEKERNEIFVKTVARLPEIQRRRFLLYYEWRWLWFCYA